MKIIPKLTLALVGGTCAVLAFNGYLRVRREIGVFEAERAREHEIMGRSLAAAMSAVWKSDGEAAAQLTFAASERRLGPAVHGRWIDAEGLAAVPLESRSILATAPTGAPVTRVVRGDIDTWYTYVPIDIDGVRRGAIELTEPAAAERRFVRTVVTDTTKTALALAVLSAFLSYVLGQLLLGRPVRALSEKARRIGRGDFADPVILPDGDELADLAREMNAMSDRLAATLEQLRHADRLATVGKLASGIAHELGTPLNVVSARASMIATGDATVEESREYARIIHDATGRMTRIIRQLMQFARRKGVTKARTDLRQLARDTVELLRPLAKKRGVEVVVEDDDDETTALVDAAQAQQVVTNLVVNAIQASPGGGHVNVAVERRRATPPREVGEAAIDCLCLSVVDDGEGISAENLPRIFEPFFTTKDVGDGTGLGLAVAYGIVRDHGGWIEAESRVGAGSSFTICFPRDVS